MTTAAQHRRRRRRRLPRPLLLLPLLSWLDVSHAYDPSCPPGYSGYKSGPDCTTYFVCSDGVVASQPMHCSAGTIFNEYESICDFESNFVCGSTPPPSRRPTKRPTVSPTARLMPTTPPPTLPPQTRSPSANVGVEDALHYARRDIDRKLFVYQSGWSDWVPSTQYRYDGFLRGLQVMYLEGVGDTTFYLGEDVPGTEGTKVGLVNIAAFLAQSMKETIKYDACDENNWDIIDGTYPLSNACGQLEQSYQDYVCPPGQEHMQCDVDPNMEQKATTQANWYGAPGPLFCGPKRKYPFVGYWDYTHVCDFPWKDPPELCGDYPGQRGGRYVNDEPVENRNGRSDVEGCCWWGRGVIQTTGVCNFGMLNYYLGKRAFVEGRDSRYPHIDFCKDPGAVCDRAEHPELKWIAGMFYWIRSLQTYNEGWSYIDNLKSFVRGGMKDDSFIDAVSGIVNRGCHNPPCGTGPLDGGYERKENFKKVLGVLLEPDGSPRREAPLPTYMPTYPPEEPEAAEEAEVGAAPPRPPPQPTESSDYENNEAWVNDEGVTDEWADGDEGEGAGEEEEAWSDYEDEEVLELVGRVGEEEEDWSEYEDEEDWSEYEDEEDWSEYEDEEDWSEYSSSSDKSFWCGQTQYDALQNCGRNGFDCSDGVCHNELRCFIVDEVCSGDDEEEGEIANTQQNPPPASPKPTKMPTPRPTTAAQSPLAPSSKGNSLSTVVGESAPVNNIGLRQQYCAASKAALATACVTAPTCERSEDCPSGTYCWGAQMCGPEPVPVPAVLPPEPIPTYMPTYAPTQPSDAASIGFDITATFFCGTDRTDASTSCHKRCRSGSREDCDEGETCFGYTSCEAEIPRAPAAVEESEAEKGPPATGATNSSPASNANSGRNPPAGIKPPTQMPTPRPTPKPTEGSANASQSTPAVPEMQLWCAHAISELEASCETAQSCITGPCPSGMFCFPYTCAKIAAGGEELPPASAPNDSVTNDGKPTSAGNQGPVPVENQPLAPSVENQQQRPELCPQSQSSFVGWHAKSDCKEYYKCDNGEPGAIYVCGDSLKFDKVRNECQPEQTVNSYCYGSPLENNDAQEAAQQKTPADDQQQRPELCPQSQSLYEEWHTMSDCKEYYKCDNGKPGAIRVCRDSLKFDKIRNECRPEQTVNSYCYGPQPETSDAQAAAQQPPAENQPLAPSVENQHQRPELCPQSQSSFVGWRARSDCKEYYKCDNGKPGIIQICGDLMKFDKVRNQCRPHQTVNSYCYGPPLDNDEAQGSGNGSASGGLCKQGFTGWEARLGCREYFWCDNGVADFMYDCGEDLLFDRTIELCNFAHLVHCVDKGGPATPRPATAPSAREPTERRTFPPLSEWPTSVKDMLEGNNRSPSNGGGGGAGGNGGLNGGVGVPSNGVGGGAGGNGGLNGGVGVPSNGGGGDAGGNGWLNGEVGVLSSSGTATPTVPGGRSETPPWLMNVVGMDDEGINGSGDILGRATWLLLFVTIEFFMLW